MKRIGIVAVLFAAAAMSVAHPNVSAVAEEEAGWTPLFDGESLEGWDTAGGRAKYEAVDGMIVGTTVEGSPNTFLTKGPYSDFVLEFQVLCDDELNSGVQIRSQIDEGKNNKKTLFGYQCEIAPGDLANCGNFWDEARAGKWWDNFDDTPEAKTAFKKGEWNKYRIVAQGNHIQSWVNGVKCADFKDSTDASGVIGLQVHGIAKGTGPYQVRWKEIRIRELKPGEKVAEG